jgi:hypothetical protein
MKESWYPQNHKVLPFFIAETGIPVTGGIITGHIYEISPVRGTF